MAADGYGAETDGVPFTGEGTDWQDIMLNTAMVYKVNVGITGGSKNASFSASGGYLNKDGIMRNSSHESYNIRLKSDFSFLNNRVTVGESLILRLAEGKGGTDQDTMNGLLRFPTVIRYSTSNATGWGTSADINLPNPYAISEINDITSETTQIFLNAYIQAEINQRAEIQTESGFEKKSYEEPELYRCIRLGYLRHQRSSGSFRKFLQLRLMGT